MTPTTKFTGLLLASGVAQGDPLSTVLEALAPFSLVVLDSQTLQIRGRFIYTLLVELSPDHVEPLAADLDQISAKGEVDIAYDFTPFALPEKSEALAFRSVSVATSMTPAQILELHQSITKFGTVTQQNLSLEDSYSVLVIEFLVSSENSQLVRESLIRASQELKIASSVEALRESRLGCEAILLDMDSTFINEEVIDEIAALAGVGDAVAKITERAMQGELDFAEALKERVLLLKGTPVHLLEEVRSKLSFTLGAQELVSRAQARGARVGIVSGGFHDVIDDLLAPLKLDLVVANRFEIIDGVLTGEILGPIVDRDVKAATLSSFAKGSSRSIAIGDGANDSEMVKTADIGVAFCAKESLRAVADLQLDIRDLRALLPLIGY